VYWNSSGDALGQLPLIAELKQRHV
jgi:hypothetical protein